MNREGALALSAPPPSRPRWLALAGLLWLAAGSMLLAAAFRRVDERPSEPPPAPAPSPPSASPSASPPSPADSSLLPGQPPNPSPQASGAAPDGPSPGDQEPEPKTLAEQRERLFSRMEKELAIADEPMAQVKAIFEASTWLGQGNPEITWHPMSRAECWKIRDQERLPRTIDDPRCGARNMVPVWGEGQSRETAPICIDQYEFPDLACEYPVVNVRASEADALCRAVGKRLCDAHEWEGACAGKLLSPDTEYGWNRPRIEFSYHHNQLREKVWAYGPQKDHSLCATGSKRSVECDGGGWTKCGSNTYPAGAFPRCVSPFGVFDQHGNAAEHMSLPSQPDELKGGGEGGMTEMKGSWFIFGAMEAHEDDCRFRAPSWHETRVRNANSHRNYHLGFRCCKDVTSAGDGGDGDGG